MRRGDIMTILFMIGDEVVQLRRTFDDLSESMRDHERAQLVAALDRIESQQARLWDDTGWRRRREH